MLSAGLIIVVSLCYLLDYPGFAFWIICYCSVNSLFALIKAFLNREWYEQRALEAGVETNYVMLVAAKSVAITINVFVAWFMGKSAGYF